ncbi:hypothetical protein BX600DRAFT_120248 [Xylariales sp. PMI_506]|nr:hypothetical protein BX600DRAFT_120248 [Xylariales sp. PMI_506]
MVTHTWTYANADDLPGLENLLIQAFKEKPDFNDLFPSEEGARAWMRSMYAVSIDPPAVNRHCEPWQERKVLVIRDEDGRVISSIVYFIIKPDDKGLWAWNKRFPPPSPEMGLDSNVIAKIFANTELKSAKFMGDEPHIYVELAITLETHQRRGYMGKLLDIGNELADQMGYPLFLVSSKAGKPGYLKKGYELLDPDETIPYAMLRKKQSNRLQDN